MSIIILGLIISSIVRSNNLTLFIGNCLVTVIMAGFIFSDRIETISHHLKKKIPFIALCMLSLQFLIHSWIEGGEARQMITNPPQPERYQHDTKVYLRAYYLMNQDISYHQAIATSYDQDTRTKGNPPDLWGFRFPTVFYFWHIATFGQAIGIYYLFLLNGLLILGLSYKIARIHISPGVALLAPTLVLPYLVMGSTTPELLQMEWWGIAPLFLCMWGIMTKKTIPIFLGALVAVMCRETYALPIIGLFLAAIVGKDKATLKGILYAGIGAFLLFLLHFQAVTQIMQLTQQQIFTGRQHVLTFEFIRQVLAYATQRYLGAPYKLFSIYIFMSCIMAGKALFRHHGQIPLYSTLLFPIGLSLIAFIRIGLCCWSDYWGVMIGPLLCLITAISVGVQLPQQKNI